MDKYLTIRVVCPDLRTSGQEKVLYHFNVKVDDSLDVPFKALIEAFRILYHKAGTRIVFGFEL